MLKHIIIYQILSIICLFSTQKGIAQDTVKDRVKPPIGYTRVTVEENSFGAFLRNMSLLPSGSPVLDYRGEEIYDQDNHIGIINYDVGHKDLQQCADAVIRLRTEYLWSQEKYDKISFHFTSGDVYSWEDHKKGIRPIVSGNKVSFASKKGYDDSYRNLKNYLDYIYMYAGTISINKEMKKVGLQEDIHIGDVIVVPGSPGHAVIIIDEAENTSGDKVFLLAQGFTPAQSIHILKNNGDVNLNNWYSIKNGETTTTARFVFYDTNVRRFKD
ncbi:DUF4846 domain-containing protein [Flammeovirga agarivorans]|uniref:DUF4846 domain-containing protein n=1 Tax=Flammeovirga agarivorans TaxID=2726742 RepID=A0A7X8XXJ9_9BACT|nr:DUF4846 domain-containing protein [Flammeovirga agarivorans]NLR93286.1 DUF4846 domain-containing protein [Flammeovirga agarivorans]